MRAGISRCDVSIVQMVEDTLRLASPPAFDRDMLTELLKKRLAERARSRWNVDKDLSGIGRCREVSGGVGRCREVSGGVGIRTPWYSRSDG